MDVFVPLLTWTLLGSITLFVCIRQVPPAERAWVARTLIIALTLRLLCATMFAVIPETRVFHEDAIGYEINGMNIAHRWLGHAPPLLTAPQNYGWTYVCAALYYVFGFFQVAPSYLNSLLGTVTIFLIYRLARQFFHPLVARGAARFCALVPSMVLWSSIALKDTLVTLLIVVALSGCVALKRRFSVGALLATAVPAALVQPVRFYMLYFLVAAILLSLLFDRGMKMMTGVPKQALVAAAVVGVLVLTGVAGRAQDGADRLSLEQVSMFRQGMATTANSGFAQDVDVSTPGGAIAFLPLGLAVLLLGPFPWQFGSLRAALAAPETIVWWMMIPSLLRGIRFAIARSFTRISPVLFFSALLSMAYALVHGNVGSGFRQRAQVFVFLFIFAAVGWYEKRCRRAGIDPRHLLVNE